MSNLHGSIFALRALLRPGLVVPGIRVDTISRLDFAALKAAGYTGAVFDRDNCLTIPHCDSIVPEIADAWARCKSSFGPENVVVVSNSAGTSDDPLGIQAESLVHNLGVPVLQHSFKKPACGQEILRYFQLRQMRAASEELPQRESGFAASTPSSELSQQPSLNDPLDFTPTTAPTPTQQVASSDQSLPSHPSQPTPPRLLIVGDRLLTDILLSNTLPTPPAHLAIWTTRLWKTPDLPLLRFLEQGALRFVLWRRNQTFRDGVLEERARGETWLGREGWIWWIRRWALRAIRRGEEVPPEPIPPRTNELAKFVLPIPVRAIELPTTRLGWAWYYSKIGSRYAAKGGWVVLVWAWVNARRAAGKAWLMGVRKINEVRSKRVEKRRDSRPVEVKSS